jgi:hypothetical protein
VATYVEAGDDLTCSREQHVRELLRLADQGEDTASVVHIGVNIEEVATAMGEGSRYGSERRLVLPLAHVRNRLEQHFGLPI